MFQVTDIEEEILRSPFVTSKFGAGGRQYHPYAFTELGIAMLSSVLKSEQAINVNISIMRVFLKVRKLVKENENLAERLEKIEQNTNKLFQLVFERIDELEARPLVLAPKRKIGF